MTENKELIQVEAIPNTPFNAVTTEKGTFIALGRFRLTEDAKTADEPVIWAWDKLEAEKWEIMMKVMTIILDHRDSMTNVKEVQNAE